MINCVLINVKKKLQRGLFCVNHAGNSKEKVFGAKNVDFYANFVLIRKIKLKFKIKEFLKYLSHSNPNK